MPKLHRYFRFKTTMILFIILNIIVQPIHIAYLIKYSLESGIAFFLQSLFVLLASAVLINDYIFKKVLVGFLGAKIIKRKSKIVQIVFLLHFFTVLGSWVYFLYCSNYSISLSALSVSLYMNMYNIYGGDFIIYDNYFIYNHMIYYKNAILFYNQNTSAKTGKQRTKIDIKFSNGNVLTYLNDKDSVNTLCSYIDEIIHNRKGDIVVER